MQIGSGANPTPFYSRTMGFIDGSNLLIELSKVLKIDYRADKPPIPALRISKELINRYFQDEARIPIRKYWFASYQGTEQDFRNYAKELRALGFEPVLFKKNKGKEKGVDIALATEMLVNAFNQNYDTGILVAGDKDYAKLVNEVKRFGPIICGAFFQNGLSEDLQLSVDKFYDILRNVDFNTTPFKIHLSELKKSILTK
jgi:uncharacterized LabA/DUF88 family protein